MGSTAQLCSLWLWQMNTAIPDTAEFPPAPHAGIHNYQDHQRLPQPATVSKTPLQTHACSWRRSVPSVAATPWSLFQVRSAIERPFQVQAAGTRYDTQIDSECVGSHTLFECVGNAARWTWAPWKRNSRDLRFETWGSTFRAFFWTGISRTNADSQWNPVYNVFHRIFCRANETIRL